MNKSCVIAVENASLNSLRLAIKLSDTKLLVIVVPILAPITIGMAVDRSIEPDATIATAIDVVVELLCIMAVIINPINKLIKGFSANVKKERMVSSPICLAKLTNRSIEIKNSARTALMEITVLKI